MRAGDASLQFEGVASMMRLEASKALSTRCGDGRTAGKHQAGKTLLARQSQRAVEPSCVIALNVAALQPDTWNF
jgi:hypothetical protein